MCVKMYQGWMKRGVMNAGSGLKGTPACALCPVTGPPLKRTSCSRFCHILCAQWLGETFIKDGAVHGVNNVSKVDCLVVSSANTFPCKPGCYGVFRDKQDHRVCESDINLSTPAHSTLDFMGFQIQKACPFCCRPNIS